MRNEDRNWMIDFDGVVGDLQGALVHSCNVHFQTNYSADEIDNWAWWSQQPKQFADYVWKKCFPVKDWFLTHVQPYPGALEGLADLISDGSIANSVMFVTDRPAHHPEWITEWLNLHAPPAVAKIPVIVSGGDRKSVICAARNLNTVVEDGVHNLRTMNSFAQDLYLVDRPWNANELITNVTHVSGIQDAIRAVTQGAAVG